ncbi:MAG TPA: hypothetical protein VHN20_10795 [Beijerinckiaceae bacterium]|nr:hypothetical protein [Beijerinckiaceae bacterium]
MMPALEPILRWIMIAFVAVAIGGFLWLLGISWLHDRRARRERERLARPRVRTTVEERYRNTGGQAHG